MSGIDVSFEPKPLNYCKSHATTSRRSTVNDNRILGHSCRVSVQVPICVRTHTAIIRYSTCTSNTVKVASDKQLFRVNTTTNQLSVPQLTHRCREIFNSTRDSFIHRTSESRNFPYGVFFFFFLCQQCHSDVAHHEVAVAASVAAAEVRNPASHSMP